MSRRLLAAGLASWLLIGCALEDQLTLLAAVDGFSAPESVLYDAASRSWFVSNVAGSETGDGFISRLSQSGQLTQPVFAAGLNDPKGMRVDRGVLYVSDVTRVVAIDLAEPDRRVVTEIPGASFLNDVAVDPATATVYVSDTLNNAIYSVRQGRAEVVLQDPALEAPNGLLFEHGELLVASIGPDLDPQTFATSQPGRVLRLDLASGGVEPVSDRIGLLDGIERDKSELLVSDFSVGVYRLRAGQAPELIVDDSQYGLASSADIGFDPRQRILAVPELDGTRVAFFAFR